METIYRKSALGTQEVTQRSLGLPPRLRSLLIMIDGRRSAEQLAALSPVPVSDALAALMQQGLVEAAPAAAEAPAKPSAPRPASSSRAPSLETQRRDASRALTDLVGPLGEALAIKIEKAPSLEALQSLLAVANQVVRNTRGAQAAQEFAQRFGAA